MPKSFYKGLLATLAVTMILTVFWFSIKHKLVSPVEVGGHTKDAIWVEVTASVSTHDEVCEDIFEEAVRNELINYTFQDLLITHGSNDRYLIRVGIEQSYLEKAEELNVDCRVSWDKSEIYIPPLPLPATDCSQCCGN